MRANQARIKMFTKGVRAYIEQQKLSKDTDSGKKVKVNPKPSTSSTPPFTAKTTNSKRDKNYEL